MRLSPRIIFLEDVACKNCHYTCIKIVVYRSAKAAQVHLSRLMAAKIGGDKIRVNIVNPDAVISNSNIWANGWAEGRAKAYGIKVEELPAFYAKRTYIWSIGSMDCHP